MVTAAEVRNPMIDRLVEEIVAVTPPVDAPEAESIREFVRQNVTDVIDACFRNGMFVPEVIERHLAESGWIQRAKTNIRRHHFLKHMPGRALWGHTLPIVTFASLGGALLFLISRVTLPMKAGPGTANLLLWAGYAFYAIFFIVVALSGFITGYISPRYAIASTLRSFALAIAAFFIWTFHSAPAVPPSMFHVAIPHHPLLSGILTALPIALTAYIPTAVAAAFGAFVGIRVRENLAARI